MMLVQAQHQRLLKVVGSGYHDHLEIGRFLFKVSKAERVTIVRVAPRIRRFNARVDKTVQQVKRVGNMFICPSVKCCFVILRETDVAKLKVVEVGLVALPLPGVIAVGHCMISSREP